MRHGLPDEERAWSLSGREKARNSSDVEKVSVRVCPVCFAAQFSGKPVCGFCGHVFEVNSREVAHVEGELQEIDLEVLRKQRRMEQGRADTKEKLLAIALERKMRYPHRWVDHVWKARQKKKLMEGRAECNFQTKL
jgi:hypothetical protein